MAGPHVAGAAALLLSARPDLIGNPDAIKRVLMRTAVRRAASVNCGNVATTVPNNTFGWGRIDIKAAYDGALGPPSTSTRARPPISTTVRPMVC